MRSRVAGLALLLLLGASVHVRAAAPPSPRELFSQGRVDDAIAQLQARIHQAPDDVEAHHLLSRAYLSLEAWDQAVEPAERAVALQPGNSDYHLWLGRAYGRKAEHSIFFKATGWAKKAKAEFERAVELNAANVPARTDLAEYYLEAPGFLGGGKDKARAQAEQLADTDPAAAHMVKARLAEDSKDYGTAERELLAAIADSRQQPGYWLDLASFYRRRARLDDMENAINKAVAAEKHKEPVILVRAAALLLRTGRDIPGAARMLRKVLSSSTPAEDAPIFQAHYLLGTALEEQGDQEGAAQEYRAALDLAKGYKQAQKALKRLQRRGRQPAPSSTADAEGNQARRS